MAKLLILHGPNLNLLGTREPEHYGSLTLTDINTHLTKQARNFNHQVVIFQSNAEHELINKIHSARNEDIDFIIINPGAFTHTSIAIRDALLGVGVPFIEVHLSNVYAREIYRRKSYLSDVAKGVITGFGSFSYDLALQAAHHFLSKE